MPVCLAPASQKEKPFVLAGPSQNQYTSSGSDAYHVRFLEFSLGQLQVIEIELNLA